MIKIIYNQMPKGWLDQVQVSKGSITRCPFGETLFFPSCNDDDWQSLAESEDKRLQEVFRKPEEEYTLYDTVIIYSLDSSVNIDSPNFVQSWNEAMNPNGKSWFIMEKTNEAKRPKGYSTVDENSYEVGLHRDNDVVRRYPDGRAILTLSELEEPRYLFVVVETLPEILDAMHQNCGLAEPLLCDWLHGIRLQCKMRTGVDYIRHHFQRWFHGVPSDKELDRAIEQSFKEVAQSFTILRLPLGHNQGWAGIPTFYHDGYNPQPVVTVESFLKSAAEAAEQFDKDNPCAGETFSYYC